VTIERVEIVSIAQARPMMPHAAARSQGNHRGADDPRREAQA
jgi:hypothetical protein